MSHESESELHEAESESERPPKDPSAAEEEAGELALDDDISLPELDGEPGEEQPAAQLDAEPGEEETVGLDDANAEEAAEAEIDPIADVETESWETSENDPVHEDAELDEGEAESWTEGSGEDDSTPIDLGDSDEPLPSRDQGEEGLDEDAPELELPPRPAEVADEDYPDELELG
ncbi:MAG: hypothetical protein K1X94_36400 [Sandaracinaceae bacterium]|nr:hypothetical protein [Sandaracinaceae bacterium]